MTGCPIAQHALHLNKLTARITRTAQVIGIHIVTAMLPLEQSTGCYQLLRLAASYDDATVDSDIAVAIARCRKQIKEQALVAHQRYVQTFSGVRSITDRAARRQMLARSAPAAQTPTKPYSLPIR